MWQCSVVVPQREEEGRCEKQDQETKGGRLTRFLGTLVSSNASDHASRCVYSSQPLPNDRLSLSFSFLVFVFPTFNTLGTFEKTKITKTGNRQAEAPGA